MPDNTGAWSAILGQLDNTSESVGSLLAALSERFSALSDEHDTTAKLNEQLDDLSRVCRSYAVRIGGEGFDARQPQNADAAIPLRAARRPVRVVGGPDLEPVETVARGADVVEFPPPVPPQVPYPDFQALLDRVAALEATERAGGVPHWLVEALGALGDRMDDHERRITALEERANFDTVQPGASYVPEERIIEDTAAWNSIEMARRMLSAMVVREWNKAIGIRGQLLSRTMHLAQLPERSPDVEAELAHKKGLVVAQDIIDGRKAKLLDEIAGLDDLDAARSFDVKSGWP